MFFKNNKYLRIAVKQPDLSGTESVLIFHVIIYCFKYVYSSLICLQDMFSKYKNICDYSKNICDGNFD